MKTIKEEGREILVFRDEQEREEYFSQAKKQEDENLKRDLKNIHREYMVKDTNIRRLHARLSAELDEKRKESLLESEVLDIEVL
jgi:hypothetical protein